MHPRLQSARLFAIVLVLGTLAAFPTRAAQTPAREPLHWWKGNLHTHSLWSDGDDFPEMIIEWYKTNEYQFLALSDHNTLQKGVRWITVTNAAREAVFKKYVARHGPDWAQRRITNGVPQVRLKTLDEFRGLFEERHRFLLIPSEEITDKFKKHEIHINATNVRDLIKPRGGTNVTDAIQRDIDAVLRQGRGFGQPMFPHVNHPNFGWSITAEDLMPLRGEKFFEIYNGHPSVRNEGDAHHASIERIWDVLLAFRLTELGLGPLYGLAVDDSHQYQRFTRTNSNPGRGWVVVRAARLWASSLMAAMEAGDFYASSGVRMKNIERSGRGLALEIDAEAGVEYTTQFIGTLRGFDPSSSPGPQPTNSPLPVTRIYSSEIGTVLSEVRGPRADYVFHGDELYVRARIVSTKPKANPYARNEFERAWIQPVVAPEP
ncbi:MAG: hypothetical protein QOF48_550 [Verrucomicrobiota bacterium]|jgi:hypothetical protein